MTLRARLTAYYTLFFAAALLILGTGLYLLVRQLLLQSVLDELAVGSALVQQATTVQRQQAYPPSSVDLVRLRPPTLHDVETPELYVQIVDRDGTPIARSPNLLSDTLPLAPDDRQRALTGQRISTIERVGSTRVLSLLTPLRIAGTPAGVIQVAQSLRQIDRTLTVLLWALIGGGLITLLAAARGGLWLTRAALQPIDHVSATAERILHTDDLRQRVPEVATADELGRLTRTINALLTRMEQSFTAQRRFTADVAHELRTPLAAMRGNLEVLRRGAIDDPHMRHESLHDIEREVERLTRMANDLLLLAQADAHLPLRQEHVPLDELAVEVYRELRPLAEDHRMVLDLQDQLAVLGDRDRLKQALINLVTNALHHTPAGSTITLRLQRNGDHARLAVIDTGPGIAPELQATIFERFVRGDRSRARGGAGLGLAIVKWIAEAHNGKVWVRSQPGQGSTFALELPLPDNTATSVGDQAVHPPNAHTTSA